MNYKKILLAAKGVRFNTENAQGANWRKQIFENYRQHILDTLEQQGEDDSFMSWLNDMQSRHSNLYRAAGNNFEDTAYASDDVRKYQDEYAGRQRTGQFVPQQGYNTDYNKLAIAKAYQSRYMNPDGTRTSGDWGNKNFTSDGLYSAITDDRRLLGREGDWDKNSEEYKNWIKDLNSRGYTMVFDNNDKYYKLQRLPKVEGTTITSNNSNSGAITPRQQNPGFDWNKIGEKLKKNFPDLLGLVSLAGNLNNNQKVYNEEMEALKYPDQKSSYHLYRQVVGDEATKQGYYNRAAQLQTSAAKPRTSDSDRQMAYQLEAADKANELRAQGDLADNAEIRRTSEESMQKQWENKARDSEVANYNWAEWLKNKADKHHLTAQKYSADWTNVDTYLQEQRQKLQNKKDLASQYTQQAFLKQAQWDLMNNKELNDLKEAMNTARQNATSEKGVFNDADPTYRKAYKAYQEKLNQLYVDFYKRMSDYVYSAKKGSKLIPRKLQQGAPFTFYKPLVSGGEGTSKSTASSKKEQKEESALDVVKELFKSISSSGGLNSDVTILYNSLSQFLSESSGFGSEISSDQLAGLYLDQLYKLNNIKYNKEKHDKALAQLNKNEGENEYAVLNDGRFVVQDNETGNISFSKNPLEEGKTPITNIQLLTMRANNPSLAFNTDLIDIAGSGVGLQTLIKNVKQNLAAIGSTEKVIEGYSRVESGKIKAGLEYILSGAPDGDYHLTTTTKDSNEQIAAAYKYIWDSLGKKGQALVAMHAIEQGTSPKNYLLSMLSVGADYTVKQEVQAKSGRASGTGSGSGGDSSKVTPAMALSMGLGEREQFIISDKTSDGLKVYAVNLPLLDQNHHAMAAATLNQVGSGDYAGQLQLNSATMGGVKVSPEGINDILISEGRIHAAELPIDMRAYQTTGIIKPNLEFLKNIEKADEQVKQAGITNRDNLTPEQIKTINEIYSKNNLPIIYTLDSNGKPILTSEYRRFALMKATAPENAFEEELNFNDGAIEATEDDRNRFESMMKQVTGNAKYSLDNGVSIPVIGRVSGTDLYKGILYVPMTESHISALASTGFKATPEEYNEIDALDQQAEFIRSSGFKSAGSFIK